MTKSSGRSTTVKVSGDFNSAKATVWRELSSIREAAKTGSITRIVKNYGVVKEASHVARVSQDKKGK